VWIFGGGSLVSAVKVGPRMPCQCMVCKGRGEGLLILEIQNVQEMRSKLYLREKDWVV